MGDIDRFSFSLAQPSTVEITVSNDGTAENYDTVLELFNNAGASIASDSVSSGAQFSHLSISLEAGAYQFQVSSFFSDLVVPSYSVAFTSIPDSIGGDTVARLHKPPLRLMARRLPLPLLMSWGSQPTQAPV